MHANLIFDLIQHKGKCKKKQLLRQDLENMKKTYFLLTALIWFVGGGKNLYKCRMELSANKLSL